MNGIDYVSAIETHNAAMAVFHNVRDQYRARLIGDDEFLAARRIYDEATRKFDRAFDLASAE